MTSRGSRTLQTSTGVNHKRGNGPAKTKTKNRIDFAWHSVETRQPLSSIRVSRAGLYDVLFLALAARTFVTALFVIRLVRLNNGEPHRTPTIWAGGPIKWPLARIKDTELRHDAPAKTELLENIKLAQWQ